MILKEAAEMTLRSTDRTYSFEDYISWSEDERWEIIDGVPYLQATPLRIHQEISGALFLQFGTYLEGKPCQVYAAPFCVRLDPDKKNKEVKTVVEPDITIICDTEKLDIVGCNGAPDMVIEIQSPSSIRRDKVLKLNKYEQAGVREYWVVEPEQQIVNVYLLQPDLKRYMRPDVYFVEDKIKVSIFSDMEIDLKRVFKEGNGSDALI